MPVKQNEQFKNFGVFIGIFMILRIGRQHKYNVKENIFTILPQFFLNRSTPNLRMARENPNTCESIHADRMATVSSGLSSLTL